MNKSKKKKVWLIILIFAIIIIIGCIGYGVYHIFFDNSQPYSRTKQTTPTNGATTSQTEVPTEPPTERFKETTAPLPEESFVNFDEIRSNNPDIYAWIYIPNTNVDYPVAQSAPGESDSFYLNHNVYKNYQFSGTIYSEKHNKLDFSDPVTLLYGHNMLNGSMFASLHNFNDKEFFDNNNTIFIFTPDKIYTYLVYSAYQYDDRHILNSFDMSDEAIFREYLDSTLQQRPYYCNVREGIELNTNDRILTLSTCMGGGGNVRYLVQGVLVNEQPTV